MRELHVEIRFGGRAGSGDGDGNGGARRRGLGILMLRATRHDREGDAGLGGGGEFDRDESGLRARLIAGARDRFRPRQANQMRSDISREHVTDIAADDRAGGRGR